MWKVQIVVCVQLCDSRELRGGGQPGSPNGLRKHLPGRAVQGLNRRVWTIECFIYLFTMQRSHWSYKQESKVT